MKYFSVPGGVVICSKPASGTFFERPSGSEIIREIAKKIFWSFLPLSGPFSVPLSEQEVKDFIDLEP